MINRNAKVCPYQTPLLDSNEMSMIFILENLIGGWWQTGCISSTFALCLSRLRTLNSFRCLRWKSELKRPRIPCSVTFGRLLMYIREYRDYSSFIWNLLRYLVISIDEASKEEHNGYLRSKLNEHIIIHIPSSKMINSHSFSKEGRYPGNSSLNLFIRIIRGRCFDKASTSVGLFTLFPNASIYFT